MKNISKLLVTILAVCFLSCKKNSINLTPSASLNVINAVVSGTTARINNVSVTTIANNNYINFGVLTGNRPIYIYPSADSLHPYVNTSMTFNRSDVYSLFIGGPATATDVVIIKENIPYRSDSTAGIRFINLAPNKPLINITLSVTPSVNEVSSLAYKQYSDFKAYAGNYNSSYSFQIRDAANPSTVLTTFSLAATAVPRFANITLVIRQNGNGVAVFSVKNDR